MVGTPVAYQPLSVYYWDRSKDTKHLSTVFVLTSSTFQANMKSAHRKIKFAKQSRNSGCVMEHRD